MHRSRSVTRVSDMWTTRGENVSLRQEPSDDADLSTAGAEVIHTVSTLMRRPERARG